MKKPKPKKTKNGATPEELIGKALKMHKGMQYLAAESLGIAQSTLSQRIKQSPYLQEICDSCNHKQLDIAETQLFSLIEDKKDLGAICFYLKTKGKHRGYQEQISQTTVPADFAQKFDATIAQLKQLQDQKSRA